MIFFHLSTSWLNDLYTAKNWVFCSTGNCFLLLRLLQLGNLEKIRLKLVHFFGYLIVLSNFKPLDLKNQIQTRSGWFQQRPLLISQDLNYCQFNNLNCFAWKLSTLPIEKMITLKNARAWVSMVFI